MSQFTVSYIRSPNRPSKSHPHTHTDTWSKMDRGTAGTCGHVTDAGQWSLAITAYFFLWETSRYSALFHAVRKT